ncbi:MAG TPA: hypothetical protein HA263_09685 [Methanoregulaceae archaeon]|nr:hypothetical protein [Methanoregulaceae archaeon]
MYVPATSSTCYSSPGSLASIVFDTTTANSRWDMLAWTASIPPGTGINFEVRASNTPFLKDATLPAWTPVTGSFVNGKYVVTYPNIPSGRYEQWRATLTSSTCSSTPVLSDVTVYYSDWVTPIEGMSGLTFLATGFASRVNTTPGGAFVPVEIPSGIVDPNSLLPEPTETPTLIAGANATNASETPVPMDALAALNATVNATQTAATLIPVNATTVPIDTRAANVTANLTPAANATETPVPTATMAPNATANVTQPATMIPTPDVTAIPIQTVATTVIPTATVTTMPTATPTTMAPLTLL